MEKIEKLFSEKNIHKLFLITAIFLGVIASIMMPIFNDPDGQYHVAISGKIVGENIDLSTYGETSVGTGFEAQKRSYEDGFHLQKYYFTKYEKTTFDKLPRNFDYNLKNYVFWGHIVPAIGMKMGSFVYPSLGVVVTFARLASIFVCYISLFFIIKYLKSGKLLFSVISLSPVWLNQIASLSYDASSFVVVAWFIMLAINTVYDKVITKKKNILFFFASILLILVAKKNFYLLLLLLPVLYTVYPNDIAIFESVREQVRKITNRIVNQKRIYKVLEFILLLVTILFLADIGSKKYGGVIVAIKRLVRTYIYNDLNWWPDMSWLVSPYPQFNHMPIWLYGMWFALCVLLLIYNERFIKNRSVPIAAGIVFLANVFGVYYNYLGYGGTFSGYISGTQGRYFSPLLLLFVLIAGSKYFPKSVLSDKYKNILVILSFGLILISDTLLIFNTLYGLLA
ncbi:hypothetical protein BG262_08000 [Floricoccus penangensis]|uniref:Uncharacterized protein n=1 Tax=Floricoccus penangensis TaxID=1859475 RepID=A0A9Q5P0R7_9LACT|nr:DUF2142 domain-containing protein [Floricoccus penangensis]OFI47925.1 hypothetical protein BG262_08000 [Floricoccus penangensis]